LVQAKLTARFPPRSPRSSPSSVRTLCADRLPHLLHVMRGTDLVVAVVVEPSPPVVIDIPATPILARVGITAVILLLVVVTPSLARGGITIGILLVVATTLIFVREVTVVILPFDGAIPAPPPLHTLLRQTAVDPYSFVAVSAIRCAPRRVLAPAHLFPLPVWQLLVCRHRSGMRYVCIDE
ncbi:unnamed protein product, partial [Ectocarpus sp. 13 AM-2016]